MRAVDGVITSDGAPVDCPSALPPKCETMTSPDWVRYITEANRKKPPMTKSCHGF